MKKLFTLFAAMVTFVAVNAQTVDYYMYGFAANSTDQEPTLITEINLGMNDNLTPIAVLANVGPDVPNATDTIRIDVTVAGLSGIYLDIPGSSAQQLTANRFTYLPQQLLTAAEMNQYNIEGTFELCYTVRILGAATDPDANNNTACVTVNRGANGINEVAEGEVNVYPNPATTVINIDNAEGAQISVYDLSGRMVSNVNSASANQTIDASNLAKGMYIVRIVNDNNVITKKVNVVR